MVGVVNSEGMIHWFSKLYALAALIIEYYLADSRPVRLKRAFAIAYSLLKQPQLAL